MGADELQVIVNYAENGERNKPAVATRCGRSMAILPQKSASLVEF